MKAMTQVSGQAISLPDADIDTDIIYPARFLLITEKKGLGRYAFADRRDDPGFPFRVQEDRPILVAGPNFGCGSSREQAPWAIGDLGVRVIIATSFGDIFANNCFRNGILPIQLAPADVQAVRASAEAGKIITVDLVSRTITAAGAPIAFSVPDDQRETLLNGWNDTTRILALHGEDVTAFEAAQQRAAPWLWTTRI
ncbi:3-isopropylmalate dehydratase small subunit [Novosphingobium sp. Leaf2]|uniref:3-isopropylmalate dehydratase small subunit n=1 Tax=Novosphingobium sp. Leaf2 TaxID=1735670 RepID=UPI0007009A34|nr:3-isopropylmalate dehydratase small subunit [Novosphingobium sp. Leaf2]KQM22188.1 3-isopropylmalate dehydratase [Novosphingobium sp. Leaf2]